MGILTMLLPLCVLMVGGFFVLKGAVSTLEEAVYNPVEKLLLATDMQNALYRAKNPVHQFNKRGEQADWISFDQVAVDLNLSFDRTYATTILSDREYELVTTAQHEWLNMSAIAQQIFRTEESAERDNLVFEFNRGLDRAIAMLNQVESSILLDIQNQRLAAQKLQWQSIVFGVAVFAAGLLFAIAGAFVLFKSVLSPIRSLEQSINRFDKGDLNSRVNLQSNDELGHLATAFNGMAERFQKLQSELDYLSIHDSLTGLYDRPKFHEVVTMETLRAKRYERPYSILFIDIDNFRAVNECYGHLVGDSVLCSVAMQINSTIRPTDTAARNGGDEFAVLLSETDAAGAKETADRIGKAIAENPMNIGDGKSLKISVSIGFSSYPQDADSDVSMFAQADMDLEKAKLKQPSHVNQVRK
ncbi:MAG: diguanylate cyclase [Gammaproteobacteria bacterium]|nr:diguanylate cyclase [Gammaproteobacteria bacterium]MDH5727442.1 diguanylate cyclase [Gammaproteobacteria bacterium]